MTTEYLLDLRIRYLARKLQISLERARVLAVMAFAVEAPR